MTTSPFAHSLAQARAAWDTLTAEQITAWLLAHVGTVADALAALDVPRTGMAPATQAPNVIAALLAAVTRPDGQPGQPVLTQQWAVDIPDHPFGLSIYRDEAEARQALTTERSEHRRVGAGAAPVLQWRLVGDWQPADGAR